MAAKKKHGNVNSYLRGTCYVIAGMLVSFAGCSNQPTTKPNSSGGMSGKLRAVATVGMVADLVRAIGGESVEVQQLMGSGVDPHLYRATRNDSLAIRDAEVVYYCGLKLEGKMSDLLGSGSAKRPAVAVASGIPAERILRPDGTDHADPHVWMNVAMWSLASESVAKSLCQLRPEHATEYQQRLSDLKKRLEALDAFGKQVIESIPKERRILITSHDAFKYFGLQYGIEVAGIQGISTDSEAGLRRIRELVDMLVERKIDAVFVESSVPQDSVQALVRGAADRGHAVRVAGPLYSDSMGESGTYEGTYVGMMDHNFSIIASSLGGTVPEVPVPEARFDGTRQ